VVGIHWYNIGSAAIRLEPTDVST